MASCTGDSYCRKPGCGYHIDDPRCREAEMGRYGPEGLIFDNPMHSAIRQFETGATRDTDQDKLDFEAFLSPAVLQRYAEYMHEKRRMPDGSLRDGDNWQKGIPLDAYMKSMWRHFFNVWAAHRGLAGWVDEEDLCGLLFNVMGYLHELLKEER